ncbi:unnamed protein product [Albugo candida]|nr:unnamed protein product [Albugo candida]|eukprot:CCI48107.1 unnamed protein product [Albugo candida]
MALYPVIVFACPPLELIFARGTGEMPGLGIVGTPLLSALQQLVPGTEGYAVMYPATADFFTSAAVGTADAVRHIQSRAVQCPYTMFALGGYSQGAMVIHGMKLDPTLQQRSIGIASFGDPFRAMNAQWPVSSPNKIFSFCALGDPVCQNGFNGMAHMTYTQNVAAAAQSLVGPYLT